MKRNEARTIPPRREQEVSIELRKSAPRNVAPSKFAPLNHYCDVNTKTTKHKQTDDDTDFEIHVTKRSASQIDAAQLRSAQIESCVRVQLSSMYSERVMTAVIQHIQTTKFGI